MFTVCNIGDGAMVEAVWVPFIRSRWHLHHFNGYEFSGPTQVWPYRLSCHGDA